MNRIVYDLCMVASLAMVTTGAMQQWGLALGLVVGGGTLAVLTVVGVILSGGR